MENHHNKRQAETKAPSPSSMTNRSKNWLDPAELRKIRDSLTDARALLHAMGITPTKKDRTDLWARSPFREEPRPSFHINKYTLAWFDFGEGKGGGPLELIAVVKRLNIYAAGRWARENGLCHPGGAPRQRGSPPTSSMSREANKEKGDGNAVLEKKFSLLPYLHAEHPEIQTRGISPATCRKLGFGFLPASSRSVLRNRIVFQIRGIGEVGGTLKPVILGHLGRAIIERDERDGGKWRTYGGFQKKLELYNFDRILFDRETREQVERYGLLIVEGAYDVAKLAESGVLNSVATMPSCLKNNRSGLVSPFLRFRFQGCVFGLTMTRRERAEQPRL